MAECPGFDVILAGLIARRRLGAAALAEQAGVTEAGLQAALEGAVPSQALLRQLAPALGLHRADLLAIAWADVPKDLAARDWRVGMSLCRLVGDATRLAPGQVRELRKRARLMPQEPRPPLPLTLPQPKRTPGGMVLRLLANRNLEQTAGYAIWAMSGRVLSGVTPASCGRSGKDLTREELTDYISVLDISAADMSIVTGVDLPVQVQAGLRERLRRRG